MKRFLASLALFIANTAQGAGQLPVSFQLDAVPVSQVLRVIYLEVLKVPYVIEPDALQDNRTVSFRWDSTRGDIRPFLSSFLDSMGYNIETRNGIDFVKEKPKLEKTELDKELFIYRPKYRDGSYLADLLQPAFKGAFTIKRTVQAAQGDKSGILAAPPGSAAALIDRTNADILVFNGSEKEIDKLRELLPQVDFAVGEVAVRGVVYEVGTSDKDGSAFGVLASLLGGKLSLGIGAADPIGSFIRFKNITLDAVYSILSQDSRFKVMSSPSLRIRSGSNGTFSVGQDVPVLGSVSYASNGQAVQSVEYRSSGVIFNIQPTVREGVIDLNIDQQLSNFVATTTGVNNSPTLTKRALKTSVGMQDGDLIVLGGLTENKESNSRDGVSFLPDFMKTIGQENSRSEIMLVLQVQRL